ncbi:MAG: SpoIIE family protein phosphatase [Phycisphaerales bacterium]|nr:SpoIIE family protein phosphatase [Phycisphaerales bacterium]
MPFLRFVDGGGQERTLELTAEAATIGRSPTCQVVLDHELISREHARIQRLDGGRFALRDLGSRNKTFVNGQAITEVTLVPGDMLRVGEFVLEYIDEKSRPQAGELDFLTPDRTEPGDCEWLKAKSPLSLSAQQIEQLAQLGAVTRIAHRPEDIADQALAQLMLDVAAERGFIALRGEGKRDLKLVTQRGLRRAAGGSLIPVSQSFVYAGILQHVAGRYPESSSNIDLDCGYASTAVAAPLTFNGEVVGVVYVDRPADKKRVFTPASLLYVAAAGAHIGSLMGHAARRLAQTAAREEAAWVATLRRLQTSLLHELKGNDVFACSVSRLPGRCRGGDLCDFHVIDEHRAYALMLDGGGSGILGLAQAAAIRAAVRTSMGANEEFLLDPAPVMDAVNRLLAAAHERQGVTCAYVGLDITTGRLAYINAGGMAPLLAAAPGRLITLEQSSLVLGADANYSYEVTVIDLPETFRLICSSDGVTEAALTGEAFGDQRLHDLLMTQEAFSDGENVTARILDGVRAHLGGSNGDDDATVLAIARK